MVGYSRWWCPILTLQLALWFPIHAFPPAPPLKCNHDGGCILYNSYGVWNDRTDCQVPNATYPTTEEELRLAVAYANRNNLKVKVVSKFSHTIPKLACPDGGPHSFLISTSKYSSGIEIDKASLSVTVDAGVGLRQLIDAVEEQGLSLTASPYWEGVSVGGLISTGSHGSSWWGKGGAVHDHLIGLSLVVPSKPSEGHAKVIRMGEKDQLFNAARVSLGMLGVVSKVTLSLEKGFKRSITFNFTDDSQLENIFKQHAMENEFGDITWYPSRHSAVYRYDNRVPVETSGDGSFDFIGFQANSILISKSTRAAEKALEKSRSVTGKCAMASTFVGAKKLVANGLKNGLIFTGYPVVGRQGKMQTSGSCLYSPSYRIDEACAWDPTTKGLLFYESTAIFPATKFADFIRDVKKLRDLNADNFCGVDIYNGFLIRFIKGSKAYLGQSEDSVVVDFNYYRADDGETPRLNEDVWEEVEQIAFVKYGAKPHWAKNRNSAFRGVQAKYPNFGKFLAAKTQLDPTNLFSSGWSEEMMVGKAGSEKKAVGCGLEGGCVCSKDSDCNPEKGYFCKGGLVYEEARVCRFSSPSSTSSAA
ncbi:L-gulonolactone oxidase 3 [Linum perenne]